MKYQLISIKVGLVLLLQLLSACLMTQASAQNEMDSTTLVFHMYRNKGYDYEENNKIDSAIIYYNWALEVAKSQEDGYNLSTIYTDLAISLRKKSDFVACLKYHNLAIEIAEKYGDHEMVEDNLHGIGSLHEQLSEYEKAVEYYFQALALSQKRGEKSGEIVTLQNISKTYMQLNIKDLALNNIIQAEQLAKGMKNDSLMANVLHDYGEILVHFGENEQALEKLKSALFTYEKVGYKRYIGSSLVYIGDVYSKMGLIETTMVFFKRALDYQDFMDKYVLADMFFKSGELELQKGNVSKAQSNFEKSLAISAQNEIRLLHQKNAEKLFAINNSLGNVNEALRYLELSTELKSFIFGKEKTQRSSEMHFKYATEKQKQVVAELLLKRNKILLLATVIIIILIIGFLTYLAHVVRKRRLLLEIKNRDIQRKNTQLTENNEALRQYAYVAAHDLKEPLRTICSFINILEIKYGPKLEDKQAVEYMQFISDSAKRMNFLLTDLLEYSSIFHQKPGNDLVSTKVILEEICTNLKMLIDTKHAVVNYPEDMPSLLMNRNHLVQILQNLVGNAIKFNTKEKPKADVSYYFDKRNVVLSIKDNGNGIKDAHKSKIFNLFFRAQETAGIEGTGIGLSVCKSLVEKYGGNIWFESEEGRGTVFYIAFPKEMCVKDAASTNDKEA